MNFFNYDGGVIRAINKFIDCIILSLMFFICCIPVFTIGTAATSMYHTAYKVLRHDRGYVFRDYVQAFRDNFRQTVPVWLLVLGIGAVLGCDWHVLGIYVKEGNALSILGAVFIVATFFLLAWTCYLFPYMARFENTRRQSMKNAFLMAIAHLPMTILMLVLASAVVILIAIMPLFLVIPPAVYAWVQSLILERVFNKYITKED